MGFVVGASENEQNLRFELRRESVVFHGDGGVHAIPQLSFDDGEFELMERGDPEYEHGGDSIELTVDFLRRLDALLQDPDWRNELLREDT